MNRATPPPDLTMRPSQLPMPEAHTLLNGLRVLTLPDTRAPVVEFRLVLPFAGRAYDDPDWVGLASATARLMSAGTPTRTSFEIADEADRYGNLHRIVCRAMPGEPNIPADTPILVARYDEQTHLYWVERNPLELPDDSPEVHSSAQQPTQHIGGQT